MSAVQAVRSAADLPLTRNHGRNTWLVYLLGCALLFGLAQPMAALLARGEHTAASAGHRVFGTYWASGDAANHGRNPYGIQPLTFRLHLPSPDGWVLDPNLNPPLMLPFFQALARLPIVTAAYVWTAISYLSLILSGCILLAIHPAMQKRQAFWMLLSMPVMDTLALGQIYALLLLLVVVIWATLRCGRITIAALCLGAVIALKPTFLLWPALLALRGKRRLALESIATAAALSLMPLAIYGPGIYLRWFHAFGDDQHYLLLTDIALPAVGHRFGYTLIGWVLAALTGAACVYIAARLRNVPIHMLSIVGTCLCAPLAWSHYLLLTYPWMVERRWNWCRGNAALLLLIPDAIFWVMRASAGYPWLSALGSMIAMAIPLLLLVDAGLTAADKENGEAVQ